MCERIGNLEVELCVRIGSHGMFVCNRSTSLLCSEVTRSLLTMDPEFSRLAPHLTGLPMEEPVAMTTELYNDVQEVGKSLLMIPVHASTSCTYIHT